VDKEIEFLVNAEQRHVMQWMIQSIIPGKNGKIDWATVEKWIRQYRQVQVPCLLVWGNHDPVLWTSMGYEMQHEIPHARLRIIENARHSLTLEQPALCAQLLRDFVENRMGRKRCRR